MIEKKKGGIIFTSSVSAFFPVPYVGHYAATKVYELFLSATMNYELKRHNIDVQALCPGYTSTEMTEEVKGKGENDDARSSCERVNQQTGP